MRQSVRLAAFAALICLTGCLSFSIGGRTEQDPTMADEITELRKLRDHGTITAAEYEIGKLTLLQRYPGRDPVLTNPAETQLAEYPAPLAEQAERQPVERR